MVSALKYFRQDPMYPKKNRGAGWYYHRGRLTKGALSAGRQNPTYMRGEYWSKYSERIDGKKKFRPTKARNIPNKEEHQPHKADYKTRVKVSGGRKEVYFKTKRVPTSSEKGYF